MKKIFTLLTLGSISLVSADYYGQSYEYQTDYCPACECGYYQGQSYNEGGYYQGQPADANYAPRNDRPSQQNNRYNSQQQSSRNQPGRQNQPYGQNQQYSQQQRNRPSDQDQQRNAGNRDVYQNDRNQKVVSDQDISKNIRDTLSSGWFSKGFQDVTFDVNNGNVNLRGSVDTLENKKQIENSVKKIDGVRRVNNQITVDSSSEDAYSDTELQDSEKKYPQDKAATIQDRQLNAKIRDQLSSGMFSKGYEMVVIKTTNGVVVISGTVNNDDDIQNIHDKLKEIEGIKSVRNQLTVKNQ